MTQRSDLPTLPPEAWFVQPIDLEQARADEALGGVTWAARRQGVCVHRLRRALGIESPSWVIEPPLLGHLGVALNRAVDDEALGGVTWAARRQRLPVATLRRALGLSPLLSDFPDTDAQQPPAPSEPVSPPGPVPGGVRHFTPQRPARTAPRRQAAPTEPSVCAAPAPHLQRLAPPRPARCTRTELRCVLDSLPLEGAVSRRRLELRHSAMRRAVLDSVLSELLAQGALCADGPDYRRACAAPDHPGADG